MYCPSCGQSALADTRYCVHCGVALNPDTKPNILVEPSTHGVTSSTLQHEYVGPLKRLAALVIDLVLVLVFVSVASYLVVYLLPDEEFKGVLMIVFIPPGTLLVYSLYSWLFVGIKGLTIGKSAVNVRVVDKAGNVPGLRRAFLREMVGKPVVEIVAVVAGSLPALPVLPGLPALLGLFDRLWADMSLDRTESPKTRMARQDCGHVCGQD